MSSPLASSRSTHSALQDVTKGMTTEFNACVRPMIDEARRLGVRLPGTQLLFATLMGLEASLRTSAKGDQ
jgi:ketopantoate reductase